MFNILCIFLFDFNSTTNGKILLKYFKKIKCMVNINTSSDRIDQRDQSNSDVQKLLSQPYKYGFTTDVEVEEFPKGINEDIIRLISIKKEEPQFMLDFRPVSYTHLTLPTILLV